MVDERLHAARAAAQALIALAAALRADGKDYGASQIERMVDLVLQWGNAA
jgi:hypothetical protein